jgi:hypothetical protein
MRPHTPGPWQVWTSNSWRRIYSRDHGSVCEPIVQNDGHPDLFFKNGGAEGPDAKLIEAAPDLLIALKDVLRYHQPNEDSEVVVAARAAIAKAESA